MFKVVCIDIGGGYSPIVKGEIYTVEYERRCPVCNRRLYKLVEFPNETATTVFNTSCRGWNFIGDGKGHEYYCFKKERLFSATLFRLIDYSFGEDVAFEIELENEKRGFKLGCE